MKTLSVGRFDKLIFDCFHLGITYSPSRPKRKVYFVVHLIKRRCYDIGLLLLDDLCQCTILDYCLNFCKDYP